MKFNCKVCRRIEFCIHKKNKDECGECNGEPYSGWFGEDPSGSAEDPSESAEAPSGWFGDDDPSGLVEDAHSGSAEDNSSEWVEDDDIDPLGLDGRDIPAN